MKSAGEVSVQGQEAGWKAGVQWNDGGHAGALGGHSPRKPGGPPPPVRDEDHRLGLPRRPGDGRDGGRDVRGAGGVVGCRHQRHRMQAGPWPTCRLGGGSARLDGSRWLSMARTADTAKMPSLRNENCGYEELRKKWFAYCVTFPNTVLQV